jgi:hypothetical protein
MPRKYEAMKKKFMQDGMSEKSASAKAARIYNSERKEGQRPVGPSYDRKIGRIKRRK